MAWSTNIINTSVQVATEFWMLKQTKLKFDQHIHKPNLLVLNFEEMLVFSHWFQQTKLKIIMLLFSGK